MVAPTEYNHGTCHCKDLRVPEIWRSKSRPKSITDHKCLSCEKANVRKEISEDWDRYEHARDNIQSTEIDELKEARRKLRKSPENPKNKRGIAISTDEIKQFEAILEKMKKDHNDFVNAAKRRFTDRWGPQEDRGMDITARRTAAEEEDPDEARGIGPPRKRPANYPWF